MASVERRERDGQLTWLARWRDPDGRSRRKTFDRKGDAQRFLDALSAERQRGTFLDPHDRTTVGGWGPAWLAGQVQLKPSSGLRSQVTWRNQVEPRWGRVRLTAVTHSEVTAWVRQLSADGLSASSVRRAEGQLSAMLAAAVRDDRIGRNPCDGVPLPRVVRAEPRFLTIAELSALADAAGHHRTLIRFLGLTGLRFGEAAALRVGRVDLLRRRVRIVESATEVGGRVVFGTPKTHQARSVPVPASLCDELAQLLGGKPRDGLVFTTPAGAGLRVNNFRRRVFDPAAAAAGLVDVTTHDLRHTAASLAIAAGATVKGVQAMLGHASAAMTLDTYAGLFPDELDAVAERLERALSAAAVLPACSDAEVIKLPSRAASL